MCMWNCIHDVTYLLPLIDSRDYGSGFTRPPRVFKGLRDMRGSLWGSRGPPRGPCGANNSEGRGLAGHRQTSGVHADLRRCFFYESGDLADHRRCLYFDSGCPPLEGTVAEKGAAPWRVAGWLRLATARLPFETIKIRTEIVVSRSGVSGFSGVIL